MPGYVSKLQARIERDARARVSGFVYFIACGAYVKIGHSLDHPRNRMRAVATMNPHPCTLIGILEAGRDHERDLHKRFAASRHVREWFHTEPTLLAYIADACGDWHQLDITTRNRTNLAERVARDLGDRRRYWYDKPVSSDRAPHLRAYPLKGSR